MKSPIKVAIQGDRASFHEIAAHKYYRSPIQFVYCQSFAQVFDALQNHLVDRAFVAVSNSQLGEIREVQQLLAVHSVEVKGEYLLPIQQHLLGLPGSRLENMHTILSHRVALSQCSDFINDHQDALVQEYYDTAGAAKFVKEQDDPGIMAIGSEAAAKLYSLEIIVPSIHNDPDNATLFKSLSLDTVG